MSEHHQADSSATTPDDGEPGFRPRSVAAVPLSEIAEVLGRHMDRPIRAFLADPKVRGTELEDAFWCAVHTDTLLVTHEQALAVVAELEASPERVAAVLDGWRPQALQTK